jgi:thioesterase domain-containing protein/acyl carrier protein
LRTHLRASLPDYMVPQHFVELARMPLLPNGKLDRKSLPQPDAGAAPVGHTAPRNQTEAALAAIWAEVLDVDRVGVDDNFFELGGHSLLALRLMQRIEQRFDRVFRLATLFEAPTVAGLAALLAGAADAPAATCAVTIRGEGARAPLFFISGWGGAIIGFNALARQLHPDQPLYVLDTTAFGTPTHPVGSMEQVAARMIADMRRIQPEGPYYLCGFSQGGKFVYEIARQLRRAGQPVGLLAMLDCTAPGYPRTRPLLPRIAMHLRQMLRQGLRENLEHLMSRLRYFYQVATKKDFDLFAGDAELGSSGAAQAIQSVADAMTQAWDAYTPGPYSGEILLITANIRDFRPSEIDDDPFLGWGELIESGIEVRGMDAHHVRMIDPPHAPELASILSDYLQRPDATTSATTAAAPATSADRRIRPAESENAVTVDT